MAIYDCLIGEGLTEADAREVQKYADRIRRIAGSEAEAAAKVESAVRSMTELRKRRRALTMLAQEQIKNQMDAGPGGFRKRAMALFDPIRAQRTPNFDVSKNVQNAIVFNRSMFHARMSAALAKFEPNVAGVRRAKATLGNLGREIYGVSTGDKSASEFAAAWKSVVDEMIARYKAVGGHIAERADWRHPQDHDRELVSAVTADEWADIVTPALDRTKMVDWDTGVQLDDDELRSLLRGVHETIRTGGLDDVVPGSKYAKVAIGDKRNDPRVLFFKDYDSWLGYHSRFGTGRDLFAMMTGYIDDFARDIGVMETLGANPSATVDWIVATIDREEALAFGKAKPSLPKRAVDFLADRGDVPGYAVQQIYDYTSGLTSIPVNARFARAYKSFENAHGAAVMGGAFLSSFPTDIPFGAMTAKFNGLPASRFIAEFASQFNPANEADRRLAAEIGLGAEHMLGAAHASLRYGFDAFDPGITGRMYSAVIKLSLLERLTDSVRHSIAFSWLHEMTRNSGRAYENLSEPIQRAFRRYSIGPAEWDVIRASPAVVYRNKMPMLSADQVMANGPGSPQLRESAARKLHAMVDGEMEFASPIRAVRARSRMLRGTRPGTVTGTFLRGFSKYKTFANVLLSTHIARSLNEGAVDSPGAYLGTYFLVTTLGGAMAWQMKAIARGDTPADMDPSSEKGRAFWEASVLQGGGLGPLGDLLFAETSRIGTRGFGTVLGPPFAMAEQLGHAVAGDIDNALDPKQAATAANLARFVNWNTPGSNLWWSRIVTQRLMFDQIQKVVDPHADERFRAIRRSKMRDYGQDQWWRSGETAPEFTQ